MPSIIPGAWYDLSHSVNREPFTEELYIHAFVHSVFGREEPRSDTFYFFL